MYSNSYICSLILHIVLIYLMLLNILNLIRNLLFHHTKLDLLKEFELILYIHDFFFTFFDILFHVILHILYKYIILSMLNKHFMY